jgi:hypothetical protein
MLWYVHELALPLHYFNKQREITLSTLTKLVLGMMGQLRPKPIVTVQTPNKKKIKNINIKYIKIVYYTINYLRIRLQTNDSKGA